MKKLLVIKDKDIVTNKEFIKEIARQLNSVNSKEYKMNDSFTVDGIMYSIKTLTTSSKNTPC